MNGIAVQNSMQTGSDICFPITQVLYGITNNDEENLIHEEQTSQHQAPLHPVQSFIIGLGAVEYGPLSFLLFCAYCTLAGMDWYRFPLFM